VRALLEIDPNRRLSAEEALDHEWLKVDWALDSDEAAPPLDAEVLEGMRAFARSNCLKRAVLSAVAPVATVEKVSHWADQFEALDVRKEGTVSVKDLIDCLVESSATTEGEARAIAASLSGVDGQELVSYSAFLAACLSAQMTFTEEDMFELFRRLDKDQDGFVSTEDIGAALGHLVDLEALVSELPAEANAHEEAPAEGRRLSFADFRRLLDMPRIGTTVCGLWQLMAAHSGKDPRGVITRVRRGLATEEERRAENMSWRLFWKERQGGRDGSPRSSPSVSPERNAADAPRRSSSRGSPSPLSEPGATLPRESSALDCEIELRNLEHSGPSELTEAWAVATAEAKAGDWDAARLENRAWRKMHMMDAHGGARA